MSEGHELRLRIISIHLVENEDDPYVVYEIAVERSGVRTAVLNRRYRHIRSFGESVESLVPGAAPLMPGKRVVGNTDPVFVRQRTQELQAFLDAIVRAPSVRASSLLVTFLDPNVSPSLGSLGAPGGGVMREGQLHTQASMLTGIGNTRLGRLLPSAVRAWKRRWCVISRASLCLHVFASREAHSLPKLSIDLAYCSVEACPAAEALHSFVIQRLFDDTGSRRKFPTFRADSGEEFSAWIDAIKQAIALKSKEFRDQVASSTQTDPFPSRRPPPPPSSSSAGEPAPPVVPTRPPKTSGSPGNPLALSSPPPAARPLPSRPRSSVPDFGSSKPVRISGDGESRAAATAMAAEGEHGSGDYTDDPPAGTRRKSFEAEPTASPSTVLPQAALPSMRRVPSPSPEKPPKKVEFTLGTIRKVAFEWSSPVTHHIPVAPIPMSPPSPGLQSYPVSQVKQQVLAMKEIPEADADRYGVFLNEEWLEEAPAVGSFTLAESDTLAVKKLNRDLSRTMLTVSHNLGRMAETVRTASKSTPDRPPNMLPGEEVAAVIPKIVHVHITADSPAASAPSSSGVSGTLFTTNFRIVFVPMPEKEDAGKPAIVSRCLSEGFEMPLTAVQQIDKGRGISPVYGRFCCFAVKSKDFHDMRFSYLSGSGTTAGTGGAAGTSAQAAPSASSAAAAEVFPDEIVERAVAQRSVSRLFAFNAAWVRSFDAKQVEEAWRTFDPVNEYARLGLPSATWRISLLNKSFIYCASYPQAICVPATISDKELIPIFAFRTHGRIPALVWLNRENGAALLRCGQPSVGITSQRCFEDERLMEAIGGTNSQCKSVFILDARPRLAAKANQLLKGRGFESSKFYPNTSITFLGIDNIHKMSEAEAKLRKVVLQEPSEATIPGKLVATRWLAFIQLLLTSAFDVVNRIRRGHTIIIHCSDGWDRTPQLTGLALIMLDPHYRTIEGFIALIEKEWLSFGHQFDKRCAHLPAVEGSNEKSPIFLQFFDGVYQLMNHAPDSFEFTQDLLIEILDELYACRFGTFLFNSDMERGMYMVRAKTVPLWLHVLARKPRFLNPGFVPGAALFSAPGSFRALTPILWEGYYLRWRRIHVQDMGGASRASCREDRTWFFE